MTPGMPMILRAFVLLATALLLAGQGAALHHDHERAADCLPGTCAEHGSHAEPGAAVSEGEACPFCEMRGQERAAEPAPATGLVPFVAASAPAFVPPEHAHEAPTLAALRARAPPARA